MQGVALDELRERFEPAQRSDGGRGGEGEAGRRADIPRERVRLIVAKGKVGGRRDVGDVEGGEDGLTNGPVNGPVTVAAVEIGRASCRERVLPTV